jgi:hypothetical protein
MGPDGKVAKPKLSMRDVEGYDDLAPDEQEVIRRGGVTGEGQSISYKDLQGYDRELGKIIGSPSTMADVRQAAISAQEIVREMKQEIAEQVGPETAQRNAELAGKYRAFAETFFDHAGPSGSGSLVAQAAKAEEAYHGSKPFRGLEPEEVERLRSMVTMLGDHTDLPLQSKKLLASIERLWKIDSEAQELPPPRDPKPPKVTPPPEFKLLPKPPKPFTPKPVPEFEPPTSESRRLKKVPEPLTDADLEPEPKYVPPNKEDLNLKPEPEPSTVTPEQARARKKENLRKFVSGLENSRLSKSGFGALTAGGAVLVARSLLGHADLVTTGMEAVAGTGIAVMGLMGKQLTAKLLRSEAVVNALTRLTKADMDALAKLKPVDRAAALDTLSVLSREAKRIGAIPKNTPTPWVNVAKHERKTPGSLFSEGENVVESADPERGVREVKLPVEQEDQQPQEPPTPTPQEPVETPESARGLDAEEDESGEGPTLDKAGRPVVDAASIQPGASGRVLTKDLHVDPKRFQYKLNSSAEGVTNQLQGKKWNEDLAGVIQVWRDPKDGELYVVNGHHRVELANRLGADSLQVRAIDAPDVESARRVGALQNIAEGRGTAIDAAKFFRDGGYAPEDLVREGVSLGEATATNGLALSQLSDSLFDEVAQGKMPMNRGIAIGKATADPVAQQATMDLVEKAEARGRHMSDAAVAELARFTADAEENTRTEVDLFGNYTVTESLAVEKAEVSAYIKKKLRERKQTFGAVASKTKAETLASAGNKIEAAENKRISEDAAQAIELYNKLSIGKGPINDALVEAARAINDRAKPEVAKQRAYETVVQKLNEALPRTTGR